MKVMRNLGIAAFGIVLGVLLLRMPVCNSVFKQKPLAILSSGEHVAGDEVKAPLTAKVVVHGRDSVITFIFRLNDAEGKEIRSLSVPSGQPKPPRVKVFDDQGKQVYACTLEYG